MGWSCINGLLRPVRRVVALVCLVGAVEPVATALVLILLVGPLLMPLRGLLHGRPYTHAWTSFLALFYFTVGVFNVAGPMVHPWMAWLEIGFSVLLFLGAVLYVRSRSLEWRAAVNEPIVVPAAHVVQLESGVPPRMESKER